MNTLVTIPTQHGLSVTHKGTGKNYAISNDHPNFEAVKEAAQNDDPEAFRSAYEEGQMVKQYFAGTPLTVEDGVLAYDGETLHNHLSDRVFDHIEDEEDPEYLIAFIERLYNNPSRSSRQQLFGFLESRSMPIDEEGYVYGYKAIRDDDTDWHTGEYKNEPGDINEMPRRQVDDDPNNACSVGFHVGSMGYAKRFHGRSGKIVLVRFNPADAVSVPHRDTGKLRVCRYEVIVEVEEELNQAVRH